MKVLVTGGAGYVGGFAARQLLAADHTVIVLDDLSKGHRGAVTEGILVEGSVGDRPLLDRVLEEHRTEAILHFAASASVGESVEQPRTYYRNNVAHTLTLLEAAVDHGVRRVIFSSTCAVYAETERMPLNEDSVCGPASPYAFSKFTIERMIQDFSRAYGLEYVLLRYFNAAGASGDGAHGEDHDPESHLIPLAVQAVQRRRGPLKVFGDDYPTPDGTCIRDYVHVEDLARAHELALRAPLEPGENGCGQIFNVGTGSGHSVLEVLRAVERVSGEAVPCEKAARRSGDTPRLVAAPERIERALGWTPRYTRLEDIVATAWEWHRDHPEGYAD